MLAFCSHLAQTSTSINVHAHVLWPNPSPICNKEGEICREQLMTTWRTNIGSQHQQQLCWKFLSITFFEEHGYLTLASTRVFTQVKMQAFHCQRIRNMWKWCEDDLGSGDKWRDETGHCILISHNFVFSWAFSHCWLCYLWQYKTSYCWYSIDFMLTSQQCKILASIMYMSSGKNKMNGINFCVTRNLSFSSISGLLNCMLLMCVVENWWNLAITSRKEKPWGLTTFLHLTIENHGLGYL